MSCLRMRSCCGCLNTAKGTIVTGVACILASLTTFAFIVVGLVLWEQVSGRFADNYRKIGFAEDTIDLCLKVLWWGNIFTLIVIILYIILSIMLIIGARKEEFKHMIPWISATFLLLPFVTFSSILQLIFGLVSGVVVGPVLYPSIAVLIWCACWWYGFFCAVSHYRMLKGDIHRPVATLFRRDDY